MISRTIENDEQCAAARGARTLLHADAIRASAQRLLALALDRDLADWSVDLEQLGPAADFVAEVVRARYPRLNVPVHSRWRHFVCAGRDLWTPIAEGGHWENAAAQARAEFDLVITSVLLDAGAGSRWQYQDHCTGLSPVRSEGLAMASLRWFERGGLSERPTDALRVDAAALRRLDQQTIGGAFQVNADNQLLGLDGRAALLNRLGLVMESRPELFALEDSPRPGGLFDALRSHVHDGRLRATTILETVLEALGPIWQARPSLGGVPLGDCWPHPALVGARPEDGFAPLHKLSQWLSYSLIEPIEKTGIRVCGVHELTGLAEYRNGGLFIDLRVLNARRPDALAETYAVADPFVVGWRSLTVALLDRLAPMVGARLGLTIDRFPLANVLEGGTWAAGRLAASKTRADGGPPFHVLSDGTVF